MIPPFKIENVNPILNVADMKASLHFYINLLGYRAADWGMDSFTSVERDNCSIYLCENGQGAKGVWIWMGFDGDMNALRDYLYQNGVRIIMEPTNFSWAMEMHIEDPDGHVIRLGTEPDSSKPLVNG